MPLSLTNSGFRVPMSITAERFPALTKTPLNEASNFFSGPVWIDGEVDAEAVGRRPPPDAGVP